MQNNKNPELVNPSVFITLAVIDFESARQFNWDDEDIDYYNLCSYFSSKEQLLIAKRWVYECSLLFKVWKLFFRITPNYYLRSWFYGKTINRIDFEVCSFWFFCDQIIVRSLVGMFFSPLHALPKTKDGDGDTLGCSINQLLN